MTDAKLINQITSIIDNYAEINIEYGEDYYVNNSEELAERIYMLLIPLLRLEND